MRADLGAQREGLEAVEGTVERLAKQVVAGRADGEEQSARILAELAAVREVAEQAGAGVAELRELVEAMREETAAVKVQAELANAVAEKRPQAGRAPPSSTTRRSTRCRPRSSSPSPRCRR